MRDPVCAFLSDPELPGKAIVAQQRTGKYKQWVLFPHADFYPELLGILAKVAFLSLRGCYERENVRAPRVPMSRTRRAK